MAPLLPCDAPTNVERRDYVAVEHAVWDDKHEIGDIPVTIISNDPGPDAEGDEATNGEDQKGWLVLSPQATQVVEASLTGRNTSFGYPIQLCSELPDPLI